jgi:hypothetical protein
MKIEGRRIGRKSMWKNIMMIKYKRKKTGRMSP